MLEKSEGESGVRTCAQVHRSRGRPKASGDGARAALLAAGAPQLRRDSFFSFAKVEQPLLRVSFRAAGHELEVAC